MNDTIKKLFVTVAAGLLLTSIYGVFTLRDTVLHHTETFAGITDTFADVSWTIKRLHGEAKPTDTLPAMLWIGGPPPDCADCCTDAKLLASTMHGLLYYTEATKGESLEDLRNRLDKINQELSTALRVTGR